MKKFTLLVFIILFATFSNAIGGHFTTVWSGAGTDQTTIWAVKGTIDGVKLEAGDEIAVFDGSICVGVTILTGVLDHTDITTITATMVGVVCSKSDATPKNGFTEGNTISFKFWDNSKCKEITPVTPVFLDNTLSVIAAPTFAANETYYVQLTGAAPVNNAPTTNAGPDQSINEGTLVTLDGTLSTDPDGDALTYLWTPPAGITLNSNTASKPTFTAPEVTVDTEYSFSVVASDCSVGSAADVVKITVKQANKVPVANAGPDQSINEGVVVTLNGSASTDGDSDPLTYLWTAPAGITLSSTTVANPTFTAPEVNVDTDYTLSLVVNDGKENSTADAVKITVKQVNKAPVANAGADQSVNEGAIVTLDGSASSDFDGNTLTYKWTVPAGILLSSTTVQKPTFTAPEVTTNTDYTLSLTVNDGTVDSPAENVIITVKQVNKVPVANAGDGQSVNEGEIVTLDGSFSTDGDSDVLTYKWTAPAGITLSSLTDAKPTFIAPEVMTNTNFFISLVVNDGKADSPASAVTIQVKQVNKAPVANFGIARNVTEKKTVTLDGSLSSDFDGDALTYLWTAPGGITLSSTTAQKPTFTAPDFAVSNDYSFSLVVNDGKVNSTASVVVISVIANRVPVANAGAAQTQSQNSVVTLDGSGSTDPDSDVLTYLWTVPAGSGITLSSTTAQKPTFTAPVVVASTPYTFSLVVNDGVLNSPPVNVVITVIPNTIPVANAGTAQSVNENTVVTLDGSASSDGDGDPITSYKWTAPAGSGITFNDDTAQKPTFTTPEVMADTDFTISLVVSDGKDNSLAATVAVTVKQVNKAPVANAGTDKDVTEKKLFQLDGSLSSDFDLDALTYLWTAPAGITLNDATAQKPTFTAPAIAVSNNYSFSLVVNDGKANSTADQVVITVIPNKIPVANAGPDQLPNENTLVTLDGSGSTDPDADVLTYLWTAPAGITLSSTTAAKPTFTAPEVVTNTNYTFTLVVNDGALNSPADQVVVTVKQVNKAPVANAGTAKEATERKVVQLDGSLSSDPDNDVVLTYLWTAPVGITLNSTTAAKPTFTAPVVAANTDYTFSLVVNDGALSSPSVNVVITVIPNKAPVANAGLNQSISQTQTMNLNGTLSSDPESDPLTYLWTAPAGITLINPTSSNPSFVAPIVLANTDFVIKLKVNDGELDSPEDEVTIRVLLNQFPIANAGIDFSVSEGYPVTLIGSASYDPDNDPITYLWTAPAGITLSSTTTSNPTFTAMEVATDIIYTFTLAVSDGILTSTDQVVVRIRQINKAPIGKTGPDQSVNEGETVTLLGYASDYDNDALTYQWTAPNGITLSSSSTRNTTFKAPEVKFDTDFTFTFVVSDGALNSFPDDVVIKVKQVNKVPTAKAGTTQSVNEETIVQLDGSSSSDPDDDVLTYLWTAPEGITLSSNTVANPSFTAPNVKTDTNFTFKLQVNDGKANSLVDQVIVLVKQVNKAPVANAGTDQSVNEGVTVTIDGSASSDPDGTTVTYLWTAPAGITLSSTTVAKPTFSAPEVSTDTKFTFSLVVKDGTLDSPADQVVITIKQVNKAPVANAGIDQTVNEGSLVTLDGSSSSDPEGNPITFKWTAPAGITLSSTTASKPTFTTGVLTNTNFTISLVVNDGTVDSSTDQVVITVVNVDHAPYVKDLIKNVSVDKRSADQIIDLKTVFADDDLGDILTYAVSSNTNDKVVLAKITGSTLTLSFSKDNIGSSEIMITVVSNGKEASTKFTVVVNSPTGIDPEIEEETILIYPNPTKGNVQLKFNQTPKSGTWITVYSISGQIISKSLATDKEVSLNLKGKPVGLYFLKIDQETSKTYKLVLE